MQLWQEEDITEGIWGLNEEHRIFGEFLWEWDREEMMEDEELGSEVENLREDEDVEEEKALAGSMCEGVAVGQATDVAVVVDGLHKKKQHVNS